jgi:hypothetical protein
MDGELPQTRRLLLAGLFWEDMACAMTQKRSERSKPRLVLQSTQRQVLSKITATGTWHPGCGWTLMGQGDARVRQVCESLVNRGFLLQYQLGEQIGYCLPEHLPVGAKILRRCSPA